MNLGNRKRRDESIDTIAYLRHPQVTQVAMVFSEDCLAADALVSAF
jgi:hypothetical protein